MWVILCLYTVYHVFMYLCILVVSLQFSVVATRIIAMTQTKAEEAKQNAKQITKKKYKRVGAFHPKLQILRYYSFHQQQQQQISKQQQMCPVSITKRLHAVKPRWPA